MLTIIGTGMSNYKLNSYINKVQDNSYIALDKNYINNNKELLKNKNIITAESFGELKNKIKSIIEKNKPISYFVTGSPTFYSGATAIIEYLEKELPNFDKDRDCKLIQNQSAKDYIVAKLAIKEKDINTLSCHSSNKNDKVDLNYFLTKKYTLILAKENTLEYIQTLIQYLNPNNYSIIIASKLGYNNEQIFNIDTINTQNINTKSLMPYTILIKKLFNENKLETYNEEDFYQDKGMITKKDKRLLLLSYLELKPNMLLWDIGAGTGSIAITAHKIHKVYTALFEKKTKRINDIKKNLSKYKVIGASLKEGDAIINAEKEDIKPHRIVIGGGGKPISENINILYQKLKHKGIIIAIFISLNSLIIAINKLNKHNIPFETKAISSTNYKNNEPLIAEPQRLSFILKIEKT